MVRTKQTWAVWRGRNWREVEGNRNIIHNQRAQGKENKKGKRRRAVSWSWSWPKSQRSRSVTATLVLGRWLPSQTLRRPFLTRSDLSLPRYVAALPIAALVCANRSIFSAITQFTSPPLSFSFYFVLTAIVVFNCNAGRMLNRLPLDFKNFVGLSVSLCS